MWGRKDLPALEHIVEEAGTEAQQQQDRLELPARLQLIGLAIVLDRLRPLFRFERAFAAQQRDLESDLTAVLLGGLMLLGGHRDRLLGTAQRFQNAFRHPQRVRRKTGVMPAITMQRSPGV